jgi:hypothetical protein
MTEAQIPLSDEGLLLALASSDLKQAAAAARLLRNASSPNERRALETAIVVCYARPFNEKNKLGRLNPKWQPERGPKRKLHRRLLQLRDGVYAHIDPEARRTAYATFTLDDEGFVAGGGGVAEQWRKHIPLADLPAIIELCETQAERFVNAAGDEALNAIGEVR